MQGLNLILSRQSQLLVLRVLFHADTPLAGREIERRTGLSNRATMLALEDLVDCSAVTRHELSHCYQFAINRNNYLVTKVLKPAFEAEELVWTDLRKTIRRIVIPRPIAAVATGPLVRDETLAGGRVELTMLFTDGRSRIRAFSTIERLTATCWERYAIDLDPVLIDENIMYREAYDALWRRIEREGILLFGALP